MTHSPPSPLSQRKETGGRREPNPPAPSSVLGPWHFILPGRRKKCAKTCSRRVRTMTVSCHALTTPPPPRRLLALLTAITALRIARLIPRFTPFQKTTPPSALIGTLSWLRR